MEFLRGPKKYSFTALTILILIIFNGFGSITFWDGDTESGSINKLGAPLPWIIETETYDVNEITTHKIEHNYLNLILNLSFYIAISAGIIYRVEFTQLFNKRK